MGICVRPPPPPPSSSIWNIVLMADIGFGLARAPLQEPYYICMKWNHRSAICTVPAPPRILPLLPSLCTHVQYIHYFQLTKLNEKSNYTIKCVPFFIYILILEWIYVMRTFFPSCFSFIHSPRSCLIMLWFVFIFVHSIFYHFRCCLIKRKDK